MPLLSQKEEARENECIITAHEILGEHITISGGGLSINGNAYQFTISTKMFIWNHETLVSLAGALNAHEYGFWAKDDEQFVYFMIFDHKGFGEDLDEEDREVENNNEKREDLGN